MIDGIYFDGRTTRRQAVNVIIHKRVVAMHGDGVRRAIRLSKLDISERLEHAPRLLRFPDGGYIEISDARLDRMLRKNRYRDPWVVSWQNNWPLSLLALVLLLALLISGYQWGVPWAADRIAQHLPPSIEKKIGDQQLAMIDAGYMGPSKLAAAEQARLQRLFAELKQPRGEKTAYRLEFRDSQIGPNAFALPNGVIVVTDQLVRTAGNNQAVLGVLGHELGHLQRRHSLRHLLQTLGVGVVLNFLVGDVSSALAAIPTFLLDQEYSRQFEREADRYAIDMMQVNNIPLAPLADLFEKMAAGPGADATHATGENHADPEGAAAAATDTETADSAAQDDVANPRDQTSQPRRTSSKDDAGRKALPDYFSSHPSDNERIANLRAADNR